MKAFSLIEVLTSLTIGLVLLGATVKLGLSLSVHMQQERGRLAIKGNLDLARQELNQFLRGIEPDFFQQNPIQTSPIHSVSYIHGALAFTANCNRLAESDCITVFDIRPLDEEPLIYQIDQADWPHWVELSPVDTKQPPEPATGVGPMSLFLFSDGSLVFCALVKQRSGKKIMLAPANQGLWSLPQQIQTDRFQAIHLGFIEITHISLEEDDDSGLKLVYQPWVLEADRWVADRSRSSYSGFIDLEWRPGQNGSPEQLILMGQARTAANTGQPVMIGSHEFNREVWCVSWEF